MTKFFRWNRTRINIYWKQIHAHTLHKGQQKEQRAKESNDQRLAIVHSMKPPERPSTDRPTKQEPSSARGPCERPKNEFPQKLNEGMNLFHCFVFFFIANVHRSGVGRYTNNSTMYSQAMCVCVLVYAWTISAGAYPYVSRIKSTHDDGGPYIQSKSQQRQCWRQR